MATQKQTIIYLHGFRSSENGSKVEHLKHFFCECEVLGLKYDPHKPIDAAKAIADIIKQIGSDNIAGFIGTSLGGFWARWIAVKYKLLTVAINPSLAPYKTLKPGIYSKFDSHLNIVLTKQDLKDYLKFNTSFEGIKTSTLHIFTLDDEVLDSKQSLKCIDDQNPTLIYETGGHRFENFERLEQPLRDWFKKSDIS